MLLHNTVWQEQVECLIRLKRNYNGKDNYWNTYQKKELIALASYTLHLKEKHHTGLEILMEHHEENKSNLIRIAIDQYLDKHKDIIAAKK